MKSALINFLSDFTTENRLQLFDNVVENRMNYLTVVLEDIYQPQNASAVLRTCDCFGVQSVHIIENRNKFTVSKDVSLGSSKWLSLSTYNEKENNTLTAIHSLREKGYRIVATTPHEGNDTTLYDFDINAGKFALVFGSEMPGISDIVKEHADEFLKIPMYGFTESFNISVSAAIILSDLTERIRRNETIQWRLSEEEKNEIKLKWLSSTIKSYDSLVKRFYQVQK